MDNRSLEDLIEELNRKRGTSDEWLKKITTLNRWLSAIHESTTNTLRILCKGEWQGPDQHYPAILAYDEATKQVGAWIPDGTSNIVIMKDVAYFHSGIPYTATANETYGRDKSASTI